MSDVIVREVYDAAGNLLERITRPRTAADDVADLAEVNRVALLVKAQNALATNTAYGTHAALPAGAALTTTQLTTAIRLVVAEVDALAKQNNALIRLVAGLLSDVSDT